MLSSQQDPKNPYPKDLSDWIERDYIDRPSRLAWRRIASLRWLGGVVLCGLLLALPFIRFSQPRRMFASGPLAPAHAMFNDACEKLS